MASKRMKTTSAMTCLKMLLIIFTIFFLIIGVVFLVTGVLAKVRFSTMDKLSTIDYSTAPWVIIGIGSFILVVGFIGCCATCQSNTCLLRMYGLFLGLIFICELGGAVFAIVFRAKADSGFKDGMNLAQKQYSKDKKYRTAFDDVQTTLHCCGVEKNTDWWTSHSLPSHNVPMSCCHNKSFCNKHKTDQGYVDVSSNSTYDAIYTKGCHRLISEQIHGNLAIIIGTMFGVACFQLIGLILSCCLASTINSNKYELV